MCTGVGSSPTVSTNKRGSMAGYHIKEIKRGVLGEPSKIREEVEEFLDAVDQGSSIMALIELSDLIGAVNLYLEKYHPTINLGDLIVMNNITRRAFESGARS